MFTGIVEGTGAIERVESGAGGGRKLSINSPFDPATLAIGDSISTSGVCLTVVELKGSRFAVDVGPETLKRTTLGHLSVGSKVNLERSVTMQTRLGGHLVQGHVDAVGKISKITPHENAHDFEIETPSEVLELAVPRGSIAIDGISLTITGRTERGFSVMIIPHTLKVTTLGDRRPGDGVNLEADLIARYVAGLLDARGLSAKTAKSGKSRLEELLDDYGEI
jgi:riboflavin synthase